MRNVINLHIGQAGIQMGHAVWEQYCQEHSLDSRGNPPKNSDLDGI